MFARRLAALVFGGLPLLSAGAAESLGIHDTEPWIVTADNPVGAGVLIELNQLVFAGEAVASQQLPVRRLIIEAQTGRFDWVLLACHLSLPHHKPLNRLLTFELGVLVLGSGAVHGLPDLYGKSAAVWTARLGNLPQLEQEARITKIEINSFLSGVQMLQEQRIAAVVGSNYAIDWALARAGADPKQFRFVPIQTLEACLFANESLPTERRQTVRKRVAGMVADGSVQKILQRYRGVGTPR